LIPKLLIRDSKFDVYGPAADGRDEVCVQHESAKRMHPRLIEARIRIALADTPVVAINGPRQSGKTTLVKAVAGASWRYLTLDDPTTLAAARSDPAGLIRSLDQAVIDEIQRAPQLMLTLKQSIDQDRRPGRFLITGSANVLTMPLAQESLAGRIEIVSLLPLAQSELRAVDNPTFLASILKGRLPRVIARGVTGDDLNRLVLEGGYPEVLARADARRKAAWCKQYLDAIIQRDLQDIAVVDKPAEARRLIDALALQVGQLTNFSQLAGKLGLSSKTAATYVSLLEQLFIVRRLDAWHRNELKRLTKTPKVHFYDTGLVAACRNLTLEKVKADRTMLGPVMEGFVFTELQKLASWSDESLRFSHYRDRDNVEVDFVLEDPVGALVGIEVKAGATVLAGDFAGLKKLMAATADDFRLGVVLYDGEEAIPFGDRLWAAPISALWSAD
jgi:predicted AAA+ superfamily ATPase